MTSTALEVRCTLAHGERVWLAVREASNVRALAEAVRFMGGVATAELTGTTFIAPDGAPRVHVLHRAHPTEGSASLRTADLQSESE